MVANKAIRPQVLRAGAAKLTVLLKPYVATTVAPLEHVNVAAPTPVVVTVNEPGTATTPFAGLKTNGVPVAADNAHVTLPGPPVKPNEAVPVPLLTAILTEPEGRVATIGSPLVPSMMNGIPCCGPVSGPAAGSLTKPMLSGVHAVAVAAGVN